MSENKNVLRLDGEEYDLDTLSDAVRDLALRIQNLDNSFREKNGWMKALVLSNSALKEELKRDLLAQKTGLDFASMFDGE